MWTSSRRRTGRDRARHGGATHPALGVAHSRPGAGGRFALAAAAAWAVWVAGAVSPASAQVTLGGQRAGTSSGTFLRIGVGARAEAMGETFVAVANDPSAIYWNPAGLASMQRNEGLESHVDWPADIHYDHLVLVFPSRKLGGAIGLQLGVLSTKIQETTSLEPFGTGREFTYSDFVAGVAFARRWTDRLLVGAGVKFLREDLGTQIGGPSTSAVLFDMGSIFYLGLGSIRIATSLTNFGSELRPSGQFISPLSGEVRQYDGFDPPLDFRYGIAFEPVENSTNRVTTTIEMNQPADNELQLKAGMEWSYLRSFALRAGYNVNADELKFSAGAGFAGDFASLRGALDYAYTDGGFLGGIHRLSLGVRF
jgi:hypothetical protein